MKALFPGPIGAMFAGKPYYFENPMIGSFFEGRNRLRSDPDLLFSRELSADS